MGAGAWIAAGARRPVLDRERAKTAQFDAIPFCHGLDDLVEDSVHDVLDVALIEMWVLCRDARHKLGFDHCSGPAVGRCPYDSNQAISTLAHPRASQDLEFLPNISALLAPIPVCTGTSGSRTH